MSATNMPGFAAEASLRRTEGHYNFTPRNIVPRGGQTIIPQFSMKSFVCAAVVAAVLAGQEELIPVMVNVCSDAA